jgi:hypothetical protein
MSWADRLQLAINRLPWSPWLTYGAGYLLVVGTITVLKWADGAYPTGTIFPFHLVLFGTGVAGLAVMHHLDAAAGRALDAMRPALTLDDEQVASLRRRLTTMPAAAAALAAALGVGFAVFHRNGIVAGHLGSFKYATGGALVYLETALTQGLDWVVIGTFVYHGVRQLSLIDRIYRRHAVIDLFAAGPLYAFSRYAVQNALGVVAIGYAWVATYPHDVGVSVMRLLFSMVAVVVGLAFATFLWPLWGAHQRLVEERNRRVLATHAKIRAVTRRLHSDVEGGDYAAMDGLAKAITGLSAELALLEKASTWPWRGSTLRGFLTAVLLPLVVWGSQQVLAVAFLPP